MKEIEHIKQLFNNLIKLKEIEHNKQLINDEIEGDKHVLTYNYEIVV